jgi:hypothetical protein
MQRLAKSAMCCEKFLANIKIEDKVCCRRLII